MMTDQKNSPKKRGPKPVGDVAMTNAERQRRRREQLKSAGKKGFLLELEGLHLQYVETLANSQKMSTAATLRLIVERALDRYVGVMRRVEVMTNNGASDEACAGFVREHLYPTLPGMSYQDITEK
jgi:hypothetical protein